MNAPEMNDSAPKKKQPFKNDADKILLLTRALCDVKRQNNPILASKSRKKELLFDFHAFVRDQTSYLSEADNEQMVALDGLREH
jgi:hypothetical protein